jgi:hypothetical protein
MTIDAADVMHPYGTRAAQIVCESRRPIALAVQDPASTALRTIITSGSGDAG